jgi:RNase P subunit RPR2
MRAAAPKTNIETKAPSKAKAGPDVRLPIKKTFCNKCQKLVKGQKQMSGNVTKIVCPKCSQSLWSWNNLYWRSVKNGSAG